MNKDDILTKSRLENKNQDIYERELLKQASEKATIVQMVLATIFFVIQILVDKGSNWGLWAIVLSANMMIYWVKYLALRQKFEFATAMIHTILVSVMSGYHIYHLIVSSAA